MWIDTLVRISYIHGVVKQNWRTIYDGVPAVRVSIFLLNLLIAQLSQSYHDVFEDMQVAFPATPDTTEWWVNVEGDYPKMSSNQIGELLKSIQMQWFITFYNQVPNQTKCLFGDIAAFSPNG